MSRGIDVYVLTCEDGVADRRWLSRLVSRACGIPFDERKECLKVGGCGMDMGFHVVYELSYTLYPNGFGCTGDRCPSNDHVNGDQDYTPHPFGDTVIEYHDRAEPAEPPSLAFGRWDGEANTGARIFRTGPGEDDALYLFADEIDSECPSAPHWHTSGGYALRHRWL